MLHSQFQPCYYSPMASITPTAAYAFSTPPPYPAHAVLNLRHAAGKYQVLHATARWYRARVTEPLTLAARIRQLAVEAGYEIVDSYKDVPLEVRREIAAEIASLLPENAKAIQYVNKALDQNFSRPTRQGQGGGRPRTHADRCPLCEQAITTRRAHEAIARNMPKMGAKRS